MQKKTQINESDIDSGLVSRNISVQGHRTSVRLEPEMWTALKDITRRENCTLHAICSLVFLRKRPKSSLTAAIRVFVMLYYRAAATEEGHKRVGHGSLYLIAERAGVLSSVRKPMSMPSTTIDQSLVTMM